MVENTGPDARRRLPSNRLKLRKIIFRESPFYGFRTGRRTVVAKLVRKEKEAVFEVNEVCSQNY
jgi:hypothetical protein